MFLITFISKKIFFCSFALLLIVSLIPFISSCDSLSYLTIFIVFSISSFEIINAFVPAFE